MIREELDLKSRVMLIAMRPNCVFLQDAEQGVNNGYTCIKVITCEE